MKTTLSLLVALCGVPALAQNVVPLPLNYNFNGIVHAGEAGAPDAPNGFRSISDRALDFQAGIPNDPLLQKYSLVNTAATLDIVHLGNRNTVDGGNWAFDPTANGDNIGIQPTWLTNVDQSGPQTSQIGPFLLDPTSKVTVLYQISNGGGSFDVRFDYFSGNSRIVTLSGGDWFGGVLPGTDSVDTGNSGNNLNVVEGTIDLAIDAGEVVSSITFENGTNGRAGYAILAANFETFPPARRENQIPLNYNFNGIVHAGEAGMPDAPAGYRSISDRGLDFQAGVPNDPTLNKYMLVDAPGVLDIVHLGNRNLVAGGVHAFDPTADGDNEGIQPTWLTNVDQSTPQTTTLSAPILLDNASRAGVLFQVSNGGGAMDVVFGFQSGRSVTATVSAGDWFGGNLPGTDAVDTANTGNNLSLTESSIDLTGAAGEILTSITFQNGSNPNGGYAIAAMNVSGCLSCPNAGGVQNLGGGNGATLATTFNGNLGCPIDLNVSNATPNASGFTILGLSSTPLQLSLIFAGCSGTFFPQNSATVPVTNNASGTNSLVVDGPTTPNACGLPIFAQYVELVTAPCPVLLSDALQLTFGN